MEYYNFYEDKIRRLYISGNFVELATTNSDIHKSKFLTNYQKKNLIYLSNACINYLLIEKVGYKK